MCCRMGNESGVCVRVFMRRSRSWEADSVAGLSYKAPVLCVGGVLLPGALACKDGLPLNRLLASS